MAKVFLNAGHCPDIDRYGNMADSGAVNTEYGLKEAELVSKIGLMTKKYLEDAFVEVVYLQSNNLRNKVGDDDLSYPCIVEECNLSGADIAVSIHLNAFDKKQRGTETWVYNTENEVNRKLGNCIQSQIVNTLGTVDRGLKGVVQDRVKQSFILLTDMPSAIAECCFIDSEDAVILLDENNLDEIAKAIARGITDYFSK